MKSFRSIPLVMAMFAVSQLHAAIITHKVSSGISTVVADSLEKLLVPNDTLWIKADDGLASLGSGLSFETDSLTLILDADANRDGTGTLTSGFTVKSTGTNTQVRILMGKKNKVTVNSNTVVTTPYHRDNFPLLSIDAAPLTYIYPYKFDLPSDAQIEALFLLNSRADMEQLQAVLTIGNGPYTRAPYSSRYGYGYAMGYDIDMGSAAFTPMGSTEYPFRAVFDGLGHTLTNLSINVSADSIGLFRGTKFAQLRNISFSSLNVQGISYVGSIAGVIDSLTKVQNIQVQSGTLTGTNYVAGITGMSQDSSSISYCVNKASVNASTGGAGGIVGLSSGFLDHLENWGNITSNDGQAAGIVAKSPSSLGGFDIPFTVNYGTIAGAAASGIFGSAVNGDTLLYAYNYGTIDGTTDASGIGQAYTILYAANYAAINSAKGTAGGIRSSTGGGGSSHTKYIANTGKVSGYNNSSIIFGGEATIRHFLNTGDIVSTNGRAIGGCQYALNVKFGLISATITGSSQTNSEAICLPYRYGSNLYSVYNTDLATSVTNTSNLATPLDHSSIRDFENYPEPDSFKAFWHAPTSFTLPTPMNVFPDGQVYKKLRQDALVKDDTAALVLDSIRTYLPTYGNDWAYSCKARNGLATCAVSAKATTITQAYNVTGAETIVFEAAHASGLVVRDSLQVQYNMERKSAPGLSAAWPADTVVTEGTPVLLDLGQYFTDADGEVITYTLSNTKIVYSELNGDVLTLCYDKKVGKETFTVYATDAGGRVSPVASLAVTVSTLPGVLKALPVLVLKTDSVLTLDLDDYFWDADGDVLGYTVTEPKNNDAVLKGSILQIAMTSLRPDSLVITVADDDKHVLLAGLKLVNSASTVLAVHPEQRLGLELAGDLLRLTSAESATAWLRILDLQGGLRYETTLDLAVGTNALALPALPHGAYRIHVRQGDNLRTLGWEKR
jgi:hypothetical protein